MRRISVNFPTPEIYDLDPNEYPLDSQKRQEKERELQEAYESQQAQAVPESEWNKENNGK